MKKIYIPDSYSSWFSSLNAQYSENFVMVIASRVVPVYYLHSQKRASCSKSAITKPMSG